MKDVYRLNQKEIVNWIKKRLRTQDRISGVKVWLLIRTVLKLLGSTWFDEWCRSIIDNTWVLVDNQGNYIMLNRVNELILKPNPNGKNSVWIVVGDQKYQVYTRTTQNGIPVQIEPLDVKKIGDVSLDHKKAIDSTLRDLGNQNKLPELNKISDIAKQIKDAICVKSGYDIDKNIIVSGNRIESSNHVASAVIDLDELRKEMDFIKNDTEYELMDGRLNSSKGNDKNETNHVSPVKKPVSKTTLISKKPATSSKNTGVIGIGQYAKALFTRLVQQGKLTKSQIAALKDPNYCKATFGIGSFAVLVDAKTTYDKSRYYKHDSQIPFVICNNWYKQNWEKLEDWMKQNIKNDLINKG